MRTEASFMPILFAAAACSVPNAPAAIVRTVQPDAPPAWAQSTARGEVRLTVDLDDQSRLVGVMVVRSTSPALNASALDAARRTSFRTAMHDCRPIASRYAMTLSFGGTALADAASDTSATVQADGNASAPPDIAAAHVEFATRAATPAAAIAQNEVLVERYRAALRALGIDPATVVGGYYDVLPAAAFSGAPPGGGYFATREIIVTSTLASLQQIFDAAAQAGATAGTVAYDVLDHKALYDAAVLAATRDAVLRTDRTAQSRHALRGAMLRSQPLSTASAALEPVTFPPAPGRPVIPPPHPVQMHVRLAVTYELKPE